MADFQKDMSRLNADLETQGGRVSELVLRAAESYFELDAEKAASVVADDDTIDRVDVEIERASTTLLAQGTTDEAEVRSILTIVKINNELERIADCAVQIAERVLEQPRREEDVPETFRVMANSIIGMLRDSNRAMLEHDTELAERVLAFDDTVDRFTREITLDAQQRIASGDFGVPFGTGLLSVARAIERIADHCTNICEQIIYLDTGKIVRHLPEGWTKPALPET